MLSKPPFFSIITPVYNCEKYLRECIESVINQTYQSWELILVDDGSIDSSGEICDSFCNDARIKIIHKENSGALDSRLKGIANANGEYALGLDADDYFDVNCLEIIKRAIDESGCDLIFYGCRYVGEREGEIRCSLEPGKEYSKKEIFKVVIGETNHALWNKAIKMDKVKQADCSGVKKRLSVNLDYAQIIPIVCNIDTGYVISDILYNYRIYGSSISHSYKVEHILDTGIVTDYVIKKLEDALLMDKDLYKLVYISYLNMIYFRIFLLFVNKKISKEDCKNIHQSQAYIDSRRFESLKYMNYDKLMILRMFRYRQYWALKLLAWTQRKKIN